MKSPKPNDPRRLRILGFGKTKTRHGETITVPVTVEYDTWCCTEAHEYAHAFKCISDLFERSAEFSAASTSISASLEYIAEKLSFTAPATPAEQEKISKDLVHLARRLSSVYKEDEDDE